MECTQGALLFLGTPSSAPFFRPLQGFAGNYSPSAPYIGLGLLDPATREPQHNIRSQLGVYDEAPPRVFYPLQEQELSFIRATAEAEADEGK